MADVENKAYHVALSTSGTGGVQAGGTAASSGRRRALCAVPRHFALALAGMSSSWRDDDPLKEPCAAWIGSTNQPIAAGWMVCVGGGGMWGRGRGGGGRAAGIMQQSWGVDARQRGSPLEQCQRHCVTVRGVGPPTVAFFQVASAAPTLALALRGS